MCVTSLVKEHDAEILHFSMPEVLPLRDMVAWSPGTRTLSYLTEEADGLFMKRQEQFSEIEVRVLLALLESFPYSCSYEVLYANLYYGRVTQETLVQSRDRLLLAREEGLWNKQVRNLREAITRTRLKLHDFGLDIRSMRGIGYLITPHPVAPYQQARQTGRFVYEDTMA